MPQGPKRAAVKVTWSSGGPEKEPTRPLAVVGIDASATGTGLAAVDLDGRLLATTQLHYSTDGVLRLRDIQNGVADFLYDLGAKVIHVVMEQYAFAVGRGGSQSHKLGEVGGAIKLVLHDILSEPVCFPSTPAISQVKKYCLGKGNGKKEQMLKGVLKKWGADLDTNDEADAYTLARIGLGLVRGSGDTTYETDVIKSMEKSLSIWAEMPPERRYVYGAPGAWLREQVGSG